MTERQMKNTVVGLLRRTGPASAELFDQQTGDLYAFNFAAFAGYGFALRDGREIADDIFDPVSSDTDRGEGK